LVRAGFAIDRHHGSHVILKRTAPSARVVVAVHSALDKGTLRAIIRQAGLTVDEFTKLL
jgi:predicted RNA binding protein YcfA (HicA-like mRNA interferase family)